MLEHRIDAVYLGILLLAGVAFTLVGSEHPAIVAGGLVYFASAVGFLVVRVRAKSVSVKDSEFVAPRNWGWRRFTAIAPVAAVIGILVIQDWSLQGPSIGGGALLAFTFSSCFYLVWSSMSVVDRVLVSGDTFELALPLGRRVVAPRSSIVAIRESRFGDGTTIQLRDGRTFVLSRELRNYERLRHVLGAHQQAPGR